MQKMMLGICALAGVAVYATLASSATDLEAAVKERQHLMDEIVKPAAKVGGDMVKGTVPFDGGKAAAAMTEISEVPDKYVKLFPEGTAYGVFPDTEASPKIWEDFAKFETLAGKLKDATLKAASAAGEGAGAFKPAFAAVTQACKDCHQSFRVKKQ